MNTSTAIYLKRTNDKKKQKTNDPCYSAMVTPLYMNILYIYIIDIMYSKYHAAKKKHISELRHSSPQKKCLYLGDSLLIFFTFLDSLFQTL
jgi:hypothetical protein